MNRFLMLCLSAFAAVAVLAAPAPGMTTSPSAVVAQHGPAFTTFGDPDDYIFGPGDSLDGVRFDGVADIVGFNTNVGGFIRGSGTLLSGPNGEFILTAAHVVDGLDLSQTQVFFGSFGTPERTGVDVNASYIHPDYFFYLVGDDVALLRLAEPAPASAQRYTLYRGDDEVGRLGVKAGYGRSGNGNQGAVVNSGTKRGGKNRYDALGDVFTQIFQNNFGVAPLPGTQLVYDFDNGQAAHDGFGTFFNLPGLGVGPLEVCAAAGDSGGPSYIDGQVAGVTSYVGRLAYASSMNTSDVDNFLNSSFGEFAFEMRVSHYADWIDSVVVPEPVTAGGFLLGLAAVVRYLRRR
jgi:secreted trypsin-like serine protease